MPLAERQLRVLLFTGLVVAVVSAFSVALWPRAEDAGATGVATIDAGSNHTCVVTDVGSARCWGSNLVGQVGDGTTTFRLAPVDVRFLSTGAADVVTGGSHSCAITVTGSVKCWGGNGSGQLGDVSGEVCVIEIFVVPCSRAPLDVVGLGGPVMALAAGDDHTCALTTAGGVKCWGDNTYGQLGNSTTISSTAPVDVAGLGAGVVAIATGPSDSCALTMAGGIKCWGSNVFGQLGATTAELCDFFSTACSTTPLDVSGLTSNVAAMSTGTRHTCAVTISGGAKCWGGNPFGQIGDGTLDDRSTPVDVVGLASGIVSIEASLWHTCAITDAGGVKCWGRNESGEIGDGTSDNIRATPVDVLNLGAAVTEVAAGSSHTCALTAFGSVKCWGSNTVGQLGDGTGGSAGAMSTTPVDIAGAKPLSTATPCGPGQCRTATPTRTRRPTATPTRTATPLATSTPCPPSACVEMSLNVESPASQCDDPVNPTKCTLPIGTTFSLSIAAIDPPDVGYIGFGTQVFYHSLTYHETLYPEPEVAWPDSVLVARNPKVGGINHGALSSIGYPPSVSSYTGTIIQLSMTCPTAPYSTDVILGALSDLNLLGSVFITPDGESVPLATHGGRTEILYPDFPPSLVGIADSLTINCVAPPTPTRTPTATPTATPLPIPRMQKLPALQNLFLTRQGAKIPPATCLASSNAATLTESINIPISGQDPKDPAQPRRLGGFSFQVKYDQSKVCVTLRPGASWTANTQQVCTIEDSATAPALQGVARINCVTLGKATTVDTGSAAGRVLALIEVRPQPEAYSQMKPNQDNGQAVQINNELCKLTDLQGHAIPVFSCEDADVTIRFLEGDVEPDCAVNTLDTQAVAFRWGAQKGGLVYNERFNLEPSGTQADQDIDVSDLQFVYGRFGSTCAAPWPAQVPVNPKA